MVDARLRRTARLKRQLDFDRVYVTRCYAADDVLVVNGCRNDSAITRVGLSIGRKVGHAVVRNRWKRLIREAFRLELARLPTGLDLVVRPKRDAAAELSAIRRSLRNLADRIARRAPARPTSPETQP